MKHILISITLPVLIACSGSAAESRVTPAGYWEGAITLPATSLAIRVDLEQGPKQAWQGRIDIPVGARLARFQA